MSSNNSYLTCFKMHRCVQYVYVHARAKYLVHICHYHGSSWLAGDTNNAHVILTVDVLFVQAAIVSTEWKDRATTTSQQTLHETTTIIRTPKSTTNWHHIFVHRFSGYTFWTQWFYNLLSRDFCNHPSPRQPFIIEP